MQSQQLITNQEALKIKLFTALNYVLNTCVLGSNNKIKDIEKTGGWSLFAKYRYWSFGQYSKMSQSLLTDTDNRINSKFDRQSKKFSCNIKNWYYKLDGNSPYTISISPRNIKVDPLDDDSFCLEKRHKELLAIAMVVMENRSANCRDKLILLAKYLWENNTGIDRIELVPTTTFDHCIMVINRLGELSNPDTWGENAWVIDAWYKNDGLIFPATEFVEKIKKIKQFAKKQIEELKAISVSVGGIPYQDSEEILEKSSFEIKPKVNQYPTYSVSPFCPVEYYYVCKNFYPNELNSNRDIVVVLDSLRRAHKEKFRNCLFEINEKFKKGFFQNNLQEINGEETFNKGKKNI